MYTTGYLSPKAGAKEMLGEAEDGGGLPNPGRPRDDDVGDIPVPGEHTQPAHRVLVTHNLLES